MNYTDEVLLDRSLLSLIDDADLEWTDDIPDLNGGWPVEELSPEALEMLNW